MRSTITLISIALAGASLVESRGDTSQGVTRQTGPPLVRITAQQLSEAPPTYAFLVTNLADVAITGIVIGRQDLTFPISSVGPNRPIRMDSPPGWVGRHVVVEERPYLTYYWENTDPSKRTLPQQSASGFRITLPDAKKDPIQVTFDRIPFEVAFADGSSWGGLVGVDRIRK